MPAQQHGKCDRQSEHTNEVDQRARRPVAVSEQRAGDPGPHPVASIGQGAAVELIAALLHQDCAGVGVVPLAAVGRSELLVGLRRVRGGRLAQQLLQGCAVVAISKAWHSAVGEPIEQPAMLRVRRALDRGAGQVKDTADRRPSKSDGAARAGADTGELVAEQDVAVDAQPVSHQRGTTRIGDVAATAVQPTRDLAAEQPHGTAPTCALGLESVVEEHDSVDPESVGEQGRPARVDQPRPAAVELTAHVRTRT